MKLMFGVESRTDVTAYCGFITAILGRKVDAFEFRAVNPDDLSVAAFVAKEAHHLDVTGVVLAIDNDGASPFHETHTAGTRTECRYCSLRNFAGVETVRSWPRPALPPLGFVFGVPIQTIETWLLLAKEYPFPGDHRSIGEVPAGRRQLKKWLYGAEKPTLETMQRVAAGVTSAMNAAALASASRSFAHFSDQVRSELAPA